MLEAVIAGVVNFALLCAGAGIVWNRLSRVERDVSGCVRNDVFTAKLDALTEKLTRIERLTEQTRDFVTGGAHTPRPGE